MGICLDKIAQEVWKPVVGYEESYEVSSLKIHGGLKWEVV